VIQVTHSPRLQAHRTIVAIAGLTHWRRRIEPQDLRGLNSINCSIATAKLLDQFGTTSVPFLEPTTVADTLLKVKIRKISDFENQKRELRSALLSSVTVGSGRTLFSQPDPPSWAP